MSSVMKYIERCHILIEMGEGLCTRIYNAKIKFLSTQMCPPCLINPELAKIKARAEKNFPDTGDLSRIQGFDLFRQLCHESCADLGFFNDLTIDISEFRRATKELLTQIPRSLVDRQLSTNRGILILYMELLMTYIRVMIMFTSIEDRRAISAMFTASYIAAKEQNEPNLGELTKLLSDSDSIQRLFIDEFSANADFVGTIIFQFFESIMATDNCENLRSRGILNPTGDGDNMGQYARLMLNARPECCFSLYTEIRESYVYSEYVIYAFLACPSLIFHPDGKYTELFKMVMVDHLVLNVFRDTTLNIHSEFESLYNNFPTRKDNITIPKNFKIKNILRDLSKAAVSSVGLRHLERRSYIRAEIKNLKHIILAVPGLLGPKFPVILTAASIAKAEILHYFRHLGLDCRKDSKKYLLNDHFKDREICLLIDDLIELTSIVEKYREVIQMYYAEFVSLHDADYLSTLCGQAASSLPENTTDIANLLFTLPQDLRHIDIETTCNSNLQGFRLNWDRYTTILGSSKRFSLELNSDLLKFMPEVIERSHYIDNLPHLIKKYFIPYELWWYQGRIVDTFREGLELNTRSLCYFNLLTFISFNLHEDCPEEYSLLNDSIQRFIDHLLNLSTKYIEQILKLLWDYYLNLEKKTRAADAGHRLEKLALKQNENNTQNNQNNSIMERIPGYESEGFNRKYIANFIENRRSLVTLLEHSHTLGSIVIFNKEINVEIAFRQFISSYFESRIRGTVLSKGDLERPSIVLTEIITGCRVLQTIYDFINADMSKLLRIVLFRNFCETTIPPPGSRSHREPENGLIWKIAQWFQALVLQASASESGLMWIPSTNSFARAKSSLRPIDVYINREEMASLCGFVGIQGVRVIDNVLISLIMDKVITVKEFISQNQTILVEFNRHRNKCSILSGLKGTENFLTASVTAGVALAVRESLHRGVKDALNSHSPFLLASLSALSDSIRPWILQNVTAPLTSIATEVGISTPSDTALAQALRPLVTSQEDKMLFTLLPVAYASAFMSPYWTSNGNYLPAFEAFRGNQHCLALTISKLFISFIETSSSITEGRPQSMPRRKMTIADNGSTLSVALREAADTFLELSSNVILAMRIQEENYMDRTLRPMSNILELFVRYFPLMDRHCLEKYFPYAHIHASQMDIAMGKIKGSDNINIGAQMVLSSTSMGISQLDA